MKVLKSLNHIGYAVKDILSTAQPYLETGWMLSPIYEEDEQNVRIAFLTKDGFPSLELVSPPDDGSDSPVDSYIQTSNCALYHLCYDVNDIVAAVNSLRPYGFLPLFKPVESIAMQNHRICYLYSKKQGLIELVES